MSTTPTRWVEISVEAEREAVDDMVNLLNRHCQGGAVVDERVPEIGEPPATRVVVKGFLPTWDEETRRKLEIALLLLASANSGISEPHVRVLEPEDWAESWKAYFPPQHIGQHIVIVPSWHQYDPQPDEIIIHLDPGMAFGTGLHATTRLCLIALERLLRPGWRVLDVGTGSGILSIAAAKLGAASIDAIDNDAVAAHVTLENVERNAVQGQVQAALATLGRDPAGLAPTHEGTGYNLVLANILAEIIIRMAPQLAAALASGGVLVSSGIINDKAEAVRAALQEAGLVVDERLDEEHWVALVAHRP